jgi:hypothetical protein
MLAGKVARAFGLELKSSIGVKDRGGLRGRSPLGRLVEKQGAEGFCERLRAKSSISSLHKF